MISTGLIITETYISDQSVASFFTPASKKDILEQPTWRTVNMSLLVACYYNGSQEALPRPDIPRRIASFDLVSSYVLVS